VADYLSNLRQPQQPYWEPFVGGGWVLQEMDGQPVYASDANSSLIQLWRASQDGWEPPDDVTKDDWLRAKNGELPAALTAFIGIGCSFSGIWFRSFINGEGQRANPAGEAKRSLARKLARMESGVYFFSADFLTTPAPVERCLIYCDPPYRGTAGYEAVGPFDHDLFWERVRFFESIGHTVVVSEYQAPDDFTAVLEMETMTGLKNSSGRPHRRTERLFRLTDSL
jgi:DNA adenine methylase